MLTGVSNYRFPRDPGIPPGRANSGEKTAVSQTLANSVNFVLPVSILGCETIYDFHQKIHDFFSAIIFNEKIRDFQWKSRDFQWKIHDCKTNFPIVNAKYDFQ